MVDGAPNENQTDLDFRRRFNDIAVATYTGWPVRRRDASWAIMQAAALAGSGEFFSNWLKAAQTEKGLHLQHVHSQAPPEPNRWNAYQPAFFSAVDFRNLDEFAAILIPSDDTPGAREAHVAPFIDFVVNAAAEYAPEMQKEWRTAMEWLRAHEFSRLSSEEQVALVARLSAPERDRKQTRGWIQRVPADQRHDRTRVLYIASGPGGCA